MLTRLFFIISLLLALPATLPAWELSAAQEASCRYVALFAIKVGEGRDASLPRSRALGIVEQTHAFSPQDTPMYIAVVHGIYDAPGLGGTELYLDTIKVCRMITRQRYEEETKAQMRTDMATICAKEADIGAALAVKSRTMTQAQAFRMLQDVDPDYANNTELYGKLVPFVYQRRRMDPAALRVAVTQHCRAGHEAVLKQQYGVELEKGWRR